MLGVGANFEVGALNKPAICPVVIGRTSDLTALHALIDQVKSGKGQNGQKGRAALISGEAGIGKSRLTAALLERIATEPHTRLRYFCSPQHTDSAFYPIIGQMERAAGLMNFVKFTW